MKLNKYFTILIIPILLISCLQNVYAGQQENASGISLDEFTKIATFSYFAPNQKNNNLSHDELYKKYLEANERFMQSNLSAAYTEFSNIINSPQNSDFLCITMAYKFSAIGLFSLSDEAISKIKNKNLWEKQISSIKTIFYPEYQVPPDMEKKLAEIYTDIHYNNLAFEAIKELHNKSFMLKTSDYSNFLLAQAYLESGNASKALNSINKAIMLNPNNLNYKKYKAKILCASQDYSKALAIVDELLKTSPKAMRYTQDLSIMKDYILAKSTKEDYKSKYYLAKYLFENGERQRAIKEVNQAISKKKNFYQGYNLLGDMYYQILDINKAEEYYQKSLEIKKKNIDALKGLGSIAFYNGDYQKSYDFFIKAQKCNKHDKEAIMYTLLASDKLQDKKAERDNLILIVSGYKNNYLGKYVLYLVNEENKYKYLEEALSLNPLYIPIWISLIKKEVDQNHLALAEQYLNNLKYIDNNYDKYYQYLIDNMRKNIKEIKHNQDLKINFIQKEDII